MTTNTTPPPTHSQPPTRINDVLVFVILGAMQYAPDAAILESAG
jgi:hypothetical protein